MAASGRLTVATVLLLAVQTKEALQYLVVLLLRVAYIRVIVLKEAEAIKMKKAFNIFGKEVEIAGSVVGGAVTAAARSDSAHSRHV